MQDAREPTTRIRLDLAYDGGHFNGWGRQPSLRTVQGVLEEALAVIFTKHGPTPILTVAGRTDSGVHATGQVAHLDLTARQLTSLERVRGGKRSTEPHASILARRLNGIAGLSTDVYVLRAVTAAPGFDARFSALWRRYEYRVSDMDGPRNPLERHRTLWYPARVNLDEMDAAAASLVG
ncbi:MAG: truA, partial [Microbacteriaceae bacterium]|nr:truA [Microbacteriaceae bacterium]